MLYINIKSRARIEVFRTLLYDHIKEQKMRYSDQRERILKILYEQSRPVSADFIAKKLSASSHATVGAATVYRNIKLFEELGMLHVVKKVQKGYLLKKDIDCNDVEVLNDISL